MIYKELKNNENKKCIQTYKVLKEQILEKKNIENINDILNNIDIIMENLTLFELIQLLNIKNIKEFPNIIERILKNIYKIDFNDINYFKFIRLIHSNDLNKFIYKTKFYDVLELSNIKIFNFMCYIDNNKILDNFIEYVLYNWKDIYKLNQVIKFCELYNKKYLITDEIIYKENIDLFELKKNFNDDFNNEIKNIIEKNSIKFTSDILKNFLINTKEYSLSKENKYIKNDNKKIINYDKQNIDDFFNYIIFEIAKNENTTIDKIKYLNNGGYSSVYELGNKIIKLGLSRKTKKFPNNPYILKDILRKEIKNIDGNDTLFFIEITEKVNTKFNYKIEELYDLYKKVRDIGLVWTDVKFKNVGILYKDNKIYWHDNIDICNETINLYDYRNADELKVNDMIIIDSDFIYDEKDPEISVPSNSFYQKFEEKYKSEQKIKVK